MKITRLFLLLTILHTICTGCRNEKYLGLEYAYLQQEQAINPKFRGVWKSLGDGYIWDAQGDSLKLYSYTRNYCYKELNDRLEGLLNSEARFIMEGADTLNLYFFDFGERTLELQKARQYVRIDRLPDATMTFKEMQQLPPNKMFTLFLETLEENYAFAAERSIDWELIRSKYAPKINEHTSEEGLFQIMGEIVTLTKDQHTKIIAKDGRRLQYTVTPSAQFVIDSFEKQDQVQELNTYFNSFFEKQRLNISDSILEGKGRSGANGQIEWGSASEKTGYIAVHGLSGFTKSNLPRHQQVDSLRAEMAKAVSSLQAKEAIIIDISFNFGGYDPAGYTISSFFTDKKEASYKVQTYHQGNLYEGAQQYIHPADSISFTKPVYVLMTDISRSAAETFALQMKALPHVKLVGTNTLGIQSDMLGKSIGTYYLALSNQKYLTPENEIFEVRGVQPDIVLDVFSRKDVFNAHLEAVRELMQMIGDN